MTAYSEPVLYAKQEIQWCQAGEISYLGWELGEGYKKKKGIVAKIGKNLWGNVK